jgi:hypothetical protein
MYTARTRPFAAALAFPFFLSAAAAHAQAPDPAAPPATPPAEGAPTGETGAPAMTGDGGVEGVKKKKKKDKEGAADGEAAEPRVEFKGRVFARAGYFNYGEGLDIDGNPKTIQGLRLTVPSARFGLKAKPLDWVTVNLELDIAGNRPEMKDGFVQAKNKPFMVRAGQFKTPALAIFIESPWTLPVVRRGIINDILLDQFQLSGRRPGAIAQWQGGGSLDPQVTLGAFQGSQWATDEFEYVGERTFFGQSPMGRLSITPGGVELAAWGQMRVFPAVTEPPQMDPWRFWAAGLDVTADHTFASGGLRYWIEAVTGSSWLDEAPQDDTFTTFYAGRALLAFRLGGVNEGDRFFEPYVMVGAVEPDTNVDGDLIWEAKVGINVGHWRNTRLTLEYEMAEFGDNIPTFLHDPADGPTPFADSKAVLLQAGAAF